MINGDVMLFIGAGILGVFVLAAAAAVPTFIFIGSGLKKRLEADYGAKKRVK